MFARISSLALALLTLNTVALPVASANDIEDFERARLAYGTHDYARAIAILEALVGGSVPRVQNEALVLESRKYLAASYLFMDRQEDAETQFTLLVRADESYVLDPVGFPQAVLEVFARVRERVRDEREREARLAAEQEEARRREMLDRLLAQENRLRRLRELASQETVAKENSRALAMIPFGVGQFQNDHDRLGRALLSTETALAVGSIALFAFHWNLRRERSDIAPIIEGQPLTPTQIRFERVERALRISNWVAVGAFFTTAIAGIIDAQVRFRPVIRRSRTRPLPADLQGEPETETREARGAEVSVSVSPFGGALRVTF